MQRTIRLDARTILDVSIRAVLPEAAVIAALKGREINREVVLVAIGKAAWNMAKAAGEILGSHIRGGVVVTKYGHSKGPLDRCEIIEAGHPIPDEQSVLGATKVLELVAGLTPDDQVIFLVSGGGSALFEKPLEGVSLEDLMGITSQLLSCGADIVEMNTIRKHLSAVKGGRFAQQCGGATIYAIVLSDVVGDKLDAIASGPAYPDRSTSAEAFGILKKYNIQIGGHLAEALGKETPKVVDNCETVVTGSVTALCDAAAKCAQQLGYSPYVLSTTIDGEAKEFGRFLAATAKEIRLHHPNQSFPEPPCAILAGGETVVRLSGNGKGGRNQELALAAALGIEGMEEVVVFSVGSDGTDGPTEAAGGIVDGQSIARMRARSIDPEGCLANNDSYHALKASGDLVVTGPTGTNVNDLMVVLLR